MTDIYRNEKEYRFQDNENPGHEVRGEESRLHFTLLGKDYERLPQSRVDLESVAIPLENDETSSESRALTPTPAPPQTSNPAFNTFFGSNRGKFVQIEETRTVVQEEPVNRNNGNLLDTVREERVVLDEFYRIKEEFNSLDGKKPNHRARRDFLAGRYKELDQIYGKLLARRDEKQTAVITQEPHEIPASSSNFKKNPALDLFFSEGPKLTNQEPASVTVPPPVDTLELAYTVPCPYCSEAIKPSARKCRFCNEWIESRDHSEKADSAPIENPQVSTEAAEEENEQSTPNAIGRILLALKWMFSRSSFRRPTPQHVAEEQTVEDSTLGELSSEILETVPSYVVHEEVVHVGWREPPIIEQYRICTKCRESTSLSRETCDSCCYSDASLGILESVIAGDTRQVAALLDAKSSIIQTVTGKHEWTLLHMAAGSGNTSLVDLLVGRGCNVNAQNIHGKMPLHYAAIKGFLPIAEILLDNDADTHILFEGKSALEHAIENNHPELARILH